MAKTRPYRVFLTRNAERDLEDLYDYIAQGTSPLRAAQVVRKLQKEVLALALQPERGSWPAELLELGIRDFRQISLRPYRLIYRVIDRQVFVLLIVDGRRDLRALLERRLLGA
ncbi:type II toxin-antitoxin system RelE/ParE family toxin [uncultured Methylibium sp.]|uniref:type II toxin-antitoxin system RelE/ParE family toxin n=1 Tax=uncultured Methylibium sp. TaxID=381093 RepID=UPI0025CDEAC9|nr:type II toxin-antitoxin system RelE/ParE family toxin [uncultured Methylibium sp.]